MLTFKSKRKSKKNLEQNTSLRRSLRIERQRQSLVHEPCKIKTKGTIKNATRNSTVKGWARTFDKYSPSKEINLSPIKASEANLKSVLITDHYVDIFLWTVDMSEQHFYDNAFILLSYSKNDQGKLAAILHRGFVGVDMEFFNSLDEIMLLGKGAFGSVYSCRNPKTMQKYAVKKLAPAALKEMKHTTFMVNYMAERNSIIRATDSPFVVRLLYSLQIELTGDLLLFFEFCIGDLDKFIAELTMDDPTEISENIFNNDTDIIKYIYANNGNMFLEASFVYLYEIFYGLDFLVKCNIIHHDIKPGNILISENMHLKIGDFGLVQRTRMIHRKTNSLLVSVDKIEKSESTNYKPRRVGTKNYQDFELQLVWLKEKERNEFKRIYKDKEFYDTPAIMFDRESLRPSFLVDTWAAGIIAIRLLFRGFRIFSEEEVHPDILDGVPRKPMALFIANLVGRTMLYENYIYLGLINAAGEEHVQLMKFIVSIFQPRATRCSNYVKEKKMYHYGKLTNMKYIDMDKVDQFKTFSDRKFSRSTINLREIPEDLRQIYDKDESEEIETYDTFDTFFNKKENETDMTEAIKFEPGVTINIFI